MLCGALSIAYRAGQQLKRHLFFVMLFCTQALLAFYYFDAYSQINTYALWYLGATIVQMLLTILVAWRFIKSREMALFAIRDLLPTQRAFHLTLLFTLVAQLSFVVNVWDTNWQAALFFPATYWWLLAMFTLFSARLIRICLSPIAVLLCFIEALTANLLEFPFVWLLIIFPVVLFVAVRAQGPQRH